MEKTDSEATGYAIEWKVEPPLWRGGETKTLRRVGIEFILYGERIRAEIKGVNINQEDFDKKATEIAQTVVLAYRLTKDAYFDLKRVKLELLNKGEWSPLVVCRSRVRIHSSIAFTVKDAEGNVIRDSEREAQELAWLILAFTEKDVTLNGALNYYWLALKEADQLATAGNLYMAMEELWNNPEFRNLKGLAKKLGLPHNKLKRVRQMTNEGRHAFVARRQAKPLTPGQIKECKQGVRELILAYVEWLQKRS